MPYAKQVPLEDREHTEEDNSIDNQPPADQDNGSRTEDYLTDPKRLVSVLRTSTDDWAAGIISRLLETEDIRLYANDRIFALQSQAHTHDATPKRAFQFHKIRGIIRDPGMLIVQITKKSRNFGVIEWFDHDNAILRFIDAIYLCRRLSDELDQDAFSEVLGGQEQRLAIKVHATLIAALSIASIVGGAHIVHRVVEAN
ncbi:hypothetical protein Unana1_05596 [Umbelopsis nana]